MIAIIDYKAGNLTSVKRAFDKIGVESRILSDTQAIENADHIVFPGVGHAKTAMENLKKNNLDKALIRAWQKGTPLLGICLGTQIILQHSEEGPVETLGLLEGRCKKFSLQNPELSIPHMGWNSIDITQNHPLLAGIDSGAEFYFVHSYYPAVYDDTTIIATTEYEIILPCALGQKNLFATQFHPEKSGPAGLQILKNFSQWDGSYAE
ncbi:MAG: imidazole glycerol phosphate synthase subunit HisH [Fibrobacterota bacterium]